MNDQRMIEILKECLENHKKLWLWIARETRRRCVIMIKDDYFREHPLIEMTGTVPINYCYFCDFARLYASMIGKSDDVPCKYCPSKWGVSEDFNSTFSHGYCQTGDSIYKSWETGAFGNISRGNLELDIIENLANLAEEIANIELEPFAEAIKND